MRTGIQREAKRDIRKLKHIATEFTKSNETPSDTTMTPVLDKQPREPPTFDVISTNPLIPKGSSKSSRPQRK